MYTPSLSDHLVLVSADPTLAGHPVAAGLVVAVDAQATELAALREEGGGRVTSQAQVTPAQVAVGIEYWPDRCGRYDAALPRVAAKARRDEPGCSTVSVNRTWLQTGLSRPVSRHRLQPVPTEFGQHTSYDKRNRNHRLSSTASRAASVCTPTNPVPPRGRPRSNNQHASVLYAVGIGVFQIGPRTSAT